MRRPHAGKPPLVSWIVQSSLREDVADPVAHTAFVRTYMEMWPERYGRLAEAVRDRDLEQALDAALSLRSSSQMLGALNLATLACGVEEAIRARQLQTAGMLLPGLKSCDEDTMCVLLRGSGHAGTESASQQL